MEAISIRASWKPSSHGAKEQGSSMFNNDQILAKIRNQLASAAKAIGNNHELQTKFERGSELMKRDIVFCSSLYFRLSQLVHSIMTATIN